MKTRIGILFLCVSLLIFAQSILAQPPGPGGPGGPGGRGPGRGPGPGGPMALFGGEEGRKDLNLTDDQVKKIEGAFMEAFSQMSGPPPRNPRDMSAEERQKMRDQFEKLQQNIIGKVETILDKDQLEKARTRSFQAGGFAGLGMNVFAQSALKLTDEQKEKMRSIQDEMMREMGPPPGRSREEMEKMSPEEREKFFQDMRARREENEKKISEKIKAILTPEQLAQGDKMISETPDYIKQARNRGPGRGGPRDGGPPPGDGEYQPGADSWQPGQGRGDASPRPRRSGGGFPRRGE